jgi:hypothetical protein
MVLKTPVSNSKKHEIEEDCGMFQKKWQLQSFVHEINSNISFLVCRSNQTIGVCKDCNIKHKEKCDLLQEKIREDKLIEFKSGLNKQQNMFQSLSKLRQQLKLVMRC